MKRLLILALFASLSGITRAAESKEHLACVIPIREDIESSAVYLVRRGLNEARKQHADLVILDMDTNGGRVDAAMEIMNLLENFEARTVTFVNKKAYSAGAFIAVATKEIYMAPSSVIGAAAPITITPTGQPQDLPSTMEKKFASALAARVRAAAQHNGHNPDVMDAMVKATDGLKLDGKEIVKKGEILTLTDMEATATYGKPPKPLLASGSAKDLNDLLSKLGYSSTQVKRIEPTGAEQLARWITTISPILLLIGIAGIYLEFKMPGVVLPGIIGAVALTIFFFGHYIAGLSGFEEVLLFAFGLVLVAVEIFLLPGHMLPGFLGTVAILTALLWAMVDKLHGPFTIPSMPQLEIPLLKLAGGLFGAFVFALWVGRWLPKGRGPFGRLVLKTEVSGTSATSPKELVGCHGTTLSILRPSGTARIGKDIVDVISEGEFIPAHSEIVVREVRGAQVIVSKG